jgi:hypothetical protein
MALILYIVLGVVIVRTEWRRRGDGRRLDAMTVFNFCYFALFVFAPINVLLLGGEVVRQQYALETFGPGDVSTALAILLSYVLFCLGYQLKSSSNPTDRQVQGPSFPLSGSERAAKVIFYTGVLLTVVYVVQIGGITEAIAKAMEVRSGELVVESKYIGYRHLSPFSADAFTLFAVILLGKRARNINVTARDLAFLGCTFVFFVYYALTTGGRRTFIYPILLCLLVYWSQSGKVRKTAVIAVAVVFLIAGLGTLLGPIVLSGNLSAAFDAVDLNRGDWQALATIAYDNSLSGLADSYIHFVGAQKARLWQFGFLSDIVNLPRDFLPSQLLGFERGRDVSGAVTEYMLGHPLEEGLAGEETLGLHGYLLVNFGYVGMFVLFFLLGMFYKWVHVRFEPSDHRDTVGWLIYWWCVMGFFVYFRDGVLLLVLKQQMTWWLTTALLLYYRSKAQAVQPRLSAALPGVSHFSTGSGQRI